MYKKIRKKCSFLDLFPCNVVTYLIIDKADTRVEKNTVFFL